ncbi:MAG: hypothetical protein WBX50_07915 [Candidatus Deferrimicrobiaceae bacterium]
MDFGIHEAIPEVVPSRFPRLVDRVVRVRDPADFTQIRPLMIPETVPDLSFPLGLGRSRFRVVVGVFVLAVLRDERPDDDPVGGNIIRRQRQPVAFSKKNAPAHAISRGMPATQGI